MMVEDLAQAEHPAPAAAALAAKPARYLLTLSCADRIGIVADVARFLSENGCNILESTQYGDVDNQRFFYRTSFEALGGVGLAALERAFAPIAAKFAMQAEFHDQAGKTPTVLLVSKFGHCLNDLLFRWRIGALPIEVKAVISNHPDFADVARSANVPFHYLPVVGDDRAGQVKRLVEVIDSCEAELIVLARYMQVLPEDVCQRYAGRIINIHHSFLPSFKGARPYQAAHKRGVKLIGATAHYVTADLDEGPIIEQAVERVSHSHGVDDYVAVGRDVEAMVLARAVKWHAEHRVMLNGDRTVVFA